MESIGATDYAANLSSLFEFRTGGHRQGSRLWRAVTKHSETCWISPAGLLRHKSHVAGAIAKAQERREEKLGDTIFDEMRRVLAKAWELLGKAESVDDYRGVIVALREVRECLESLNSLVMRAEGGSGSINVVINCIGEPVQLQEGPTVRGETATATPPNKRNPRDQLPPEPASVRQATLPPVSSATETGSQPWPRRPPSPCGWGYRLPPRNALTRTGAAMAFLRGRASCKCHSKPGFSKGTFPQP